MKKDVNHLVAMSPYRLALWVRAVGVKPFTLNEKETDRG